MAIRKTIHPRLLDTWFMEALKQEFPFLRFWEPLDQAYNGRPNRTFVVRRKLWPRRAFCNYRGKLMISLFTADKMLGRQDLSPKETISLAELLGKFQQAEYVLVEQQLSSERLFYECTLYKRAQETVNALRQDARRAAKDMREVLEQLHS